MQCVTVGQRRIAKPISLRMTKDVVASRPSLWRKSTPVIRGRGSRTGACWLVATLLAWTWGRGQRLPLPAVRKGLERGFALAIACRALLMIPVLERHGVGQSAQMLLPPIALHSPGDGGLVVRTPVVTESGERHRITLTCEARTEDRATRHPGDVADDVRSLAMHLGERLLPRLDVLARLGEEHGALAEGTAPHADVVRRPERPGEQPKGMEALDPLAVMPIACGPTPHGLDLLRIDQAYLDATRLAQRTEREPRDPGGCHGDGRDLALRQPVCQGCEVSRVGGKAAHRLGIITGGDGHIMGFSPDIEAGGVEVGGRHLRWKGGRGTSLVLLAWGHGHLHHSRGRSSTAGAGAAGLQHSSKRDQGIACHH